VHTGEACDGETRTNLTVGNCWRYQEPASGLHPRPRGQVLVLWALAFAELYNQPTVHVQLLGNSCRSFVLLAHCSAGGTIRTTGPWRNECSRHAGSIAFANLAGVGAMTLLHQGLARANRERKKGLLPTCDEGSIVRGIKPNLRTSTACIPCNVDACL